MTVATPTTVESSIPPFWVAPQPPLAYDPALALPAPKPLLALPTPALPLALPAPVPDPLTGTTGQLRRFYRHVVTLARQVGRPALTEDGARLGIGTLGVHTITRDPATGDVIIRHRGFHGWRTLARYDLVMSANGLARFLSLVSRRLERAHAGGPSLTEKRITRECVPPPGDGWRLVSVEHDWHGPAAYHWVRVRLGYRPEVPATPASLLAHTTSRPREAPVTPAPLPTHVTRRPREAPVTPAPLPAHVTSRPREVPATPAAHATSRPRLLNDACWSRRARQYQQYIDAGILTEDDPQWAFAQRVMHDTGITP